jgi:transcriptional regulator with XRE-family HTH domain
MSDSGGESIQIGKRIRSLRVSAGMTLTDLSKAAKVSIGTLSQLERGLVSPTVRTLYTVGNALGVAPAWLIDPKQAVSNGSESTFVVRANRRQKFLDAGGIRKDIASPAASERLKGFFMVIEPGCGSGEQPYVHTGEEIGLILSGRLELSIDDQSFTLNEGDCFAFESTRPHRFSNFGPRPASVFWVNAKI